MIGIEHSGKTISSPDRGGKRRCRNGYRCSRPLTQLHGGTYISVRKGPAEEPYINHLLEVALLVADATGGKDTNLVIAALLHDAIEDCEVQIGIRPLGKRGRQGTTWCQSEA
jgi:hypothetical protein